MFRSSQVLSATQLMRNFRAVSNELREHPQALLVIQKSADPLVVVNAAIFEDLLEGNIEAAIRVRPKTLDKC